MGIMDDMKFDINAELYGTETANRKNAVQIEQERAKKVDSQKHSVPRKFLKGVAAMPEKMLNAELMGREVSNANNREQAIESERKKGVMQTQMQKIAAKKSDKETKQYSLESKKNRQKQAVSSVGLDIESGELYFDDKLQEIYGNRVTDLSGGDYSEHVKQQLANEQLLNEFSYNEGNDFYKPL